VPSIRVATPADAAIVTTVARRTFHDAYVSPDSAVDLTVHMDRHFGEPQQTAELADPGVTTLLVEVNGAAIGYAQVSADEPPACVTGPAPIRIWRFYLDQAWKGRGVAQQLMATSEAEARRRKGQTLWVVAWNRNDRALAFYRKCGFDEVGTMPFMFGNTEEHDTVMARPIAP